MKLSALPKALLALALVATPAAAETYTPPDPAAVPGYSATVLPCKIGKDQLERTNVVCKDDLFGKKTLRELAILRNTIYARYGWDGYRKPWLREHFHAQPWFKPNPRFNYKLLSDVDKKNAHFIGAYEHSLYDTELRRRRDEIYARAGKVFPDKPTWTTKDGKEVKACERPKGARCADEECGYSASSYPGCYYAKQPWYTPDPKFSEEKINPTDRIELGLLSRALGEFATDEDKRGQSERSLDRLLSLAELRALSLRDLRLLRNTIYARRGRAFKSPVLRDHFARMDWYKVDAAYSDAALTKNDTRNIALIRSVENEFGGALSDEDWLIEPATDGA